MEPLATSKKVFTWIYLCPASENENRLRKLQYRYSLLGILAFLLTGVAATIGTLYKYWSIDLEKVLYTPIQIGASLSTTYSLIIAFVLRNKILDMFNNLSRIYEICK